MRQKLYTSQRLSFVDHRQERMSVAQQRHSLKCDPIRRNRGQMSPYPCQMVRCDKDKGIQYSTIDHAKVKVVRVNGNYKKLNLKLALLERFGIFYIVVNFVLTFQSSLSFLLV